MYFVTCPKQGLEMEAVVLHRVVFLECFCPKQGLDFKSLAAPQKPNIGQVSPTLGSPHKKEIQDTEIRGVRGNLFHLPSFPHSFFFSVEPQGLIHPWVLGFASFNVGKPFWV